MSGEAEFEAYLVEDIVEGTFEAFTTLEHAKAAAAGMDAALIHPMARAAELTRLRSENAELEAKYQGMEDAWCQHDLAREAAESLAAELVEALDGIYLYANDTLSGRADGGPDDREWQRQCVVEVRNRARKFSSLEQAKDARALLSRVSGGGE